MPTTNILLNFLAGIGTGRTICGEAQTLLRCLISDFQDAGVVLHPALRRIGDKPPLLLGCMQHEFLRYPRAGAHGLAYPLEPGRAGFCHSADGNPGKGGNRLKVGNHPLHRLHIGVSDAQRLRADALCIGRGTFGYAQNTCLGGRGCARDRLSGIVDAALCLSRRVWS